MFIGRPWFSLGSGLLEVDTLDHGQALQETAQAIQGQFDRTQADPFASAQDAGAAEFGAAVGGDADLDGAAEVHAVGAVVQFDQDGEGMRWRPLPRGRRE